MSHLAVERLAELVEGDAVAVEREHLSGCPTCSRELDAYRRLVALASEERRRIGPPLTTWSELSACLHSEGLVAIKPAGRVGGWQAALVVGRRAAVALLLLGSGAVVGRFSAGLTARQAMSVSWIGSGAPNDAVGMMRNVALGSNSAFESPEDALLALTRAQTDYERAAAYLAMHDTSTTDGAADQYRIRLAALDRNAQALIQALNESPQDPVINQIYLATMGAREATLNKLGTALPVGVRLSRF